LVPAGTWEGGRIERKKDRNKGETFRIVGLMFVAGEQKLENSEEGEELNSKRLEEGNCQLGEMTGGFGRRFQNNPHIEENGQSTREVHSADTAGVQWVKFEDNTFFSCWFESLNGWGKTQTKGKSPRGGGQKGGPGGVRPRASKMRLSKGDHWVH